MDDPYLLFLAQTFNKDKIYFLYRPVACNNAGSLGAAERLDGAALKFDT